jgi:(p)ppGpp synthase/HD superfamily hydrolase
MLHRALGFALAIHGHQFRVYTHEPYIIHLIRVTEIMRSVTIDEEVLTAAMLHESIRHGGQTVENLEALYGKRVASIVQDVTVHFNVTDSNKTRRAVIKQLTDMEPIVKTLKLADLIDHAEVIISHDSRLAQDYVKDQYACLKALKGGDERLFNRTKSLFDKYIEHIANTHFELSPNQNRHIHLGR